MSKSEKMVNVSGQSIGYVTAITRFDCNKYDEVDNIQCILNIATGETSQAIASFHFFDKFHFFIF